MRLVAAPGIGMGLAFSGGWIGFLVELGGGMCHFVFELGLRGEDFSVSLDSLVTFVSLDSVVTFPVLALLMRFSDTELLFPTAAFLWALGEPKTLSVDALRPFSKAWSSAMTSLPFVSLVWVGMNRFGAEPDIIQMID